MPPIATNPRHGRALLATADLLSKLRIDCAFVGSVARSAWLGGEASGSIDVLALMAPQQKGQVAMMASNRGFRVDRDEIEQTDELDLVPLHFSDPEGGEVRVHILVASNALYARMVTGAREAQMASASVASASVAPPAPPALPSDRAGATLRVVAPEDLALLMLMAEDEVSVRRLAGMSGFNRHAYNDRLVSIGLPGMVLAE